ncbi:hypothetical protein B0T20DRAFT_481593 [Sordaria brevicollis]|uniref:TM2 domain-containing protein n=1 Tax=Sordaria brevicollis TaxID=83679 RepID=A0AAE0PB18_SORBR|nr:hypothetical protein B0T20DRAFT_481593 [Sordaria brevicollis]
MRSPATSLFLPLLSFLLVLALGASTTTTQATSPSSSTSLASGTITARSATSATEQSNEDVTLQIIPLTNLPPTKVFQTKAPLPQTTQEVDVDIVKRHHYPHHNHTQTQTQTSDGNGRPTTADIPRELNVALTLVMLAVGGIFGFHYLITGVLAVWVVLKVVDVVQFLVGWWNSVVA